MAAGRYSDRLGVDILLEGNGQLNDTLSEFMRPMIQRTTIASDGYGEWTCLFGEIRLNKM